MDFCWGHLCALFLMGCWNPGNKKYLVSHVRIPTYFLDVQSLQACSLDVGGLGSCVAFLKFQDLNSSKESFTVVSRCHDLGTFKN